MIIASDYNYIVKEQRRLVKQTRVKYMRVKRVLVLLSIFLSVNILNTLIF